MANPFLYEREGSMMDSHQADGSPSTQVPVFTRAQAPVEATFIARPNRFVAIVRLDRDVEHAYGIDRVGDEITAHVADPGRLTELLVPGVRAYVVPAFPGEPGSCGPAAARGSPGRRTLYDLVLVDYDGVLVSVDCRVPNDLVHLALQAGFFPELAAYTRILRESSFGSSRLDFRLSVGERNGKSGAYTRAAEGGLPGVWDARDCFIEVKSVTLVDDGTAMFPDAPTVRGARHMRELAQAVTEGFRAVALFVIQRIDVSAFTPNRDMDPGFSDALVGALEAGVEVWAWRCKVGLEGIALDASLPVRV